MDDDYENGVNLERVTVLGSSVRVVAETAQLTAS